VIQLVETEIFNLIRISRRLPWLFWLAVFAAAISGPVLMAQAAEPAAFMQVETETLDEQEFIFPDDMQASSLNIVMLAMSEDKDNGSWQGDALLEWYAALDEAGILSDSVLGWHFSVMKVPFFVKGLVRGGLTESYAGKIPPNQAGALFVDPQKFVASAGLVLDDQPTIVLMTPDGDFLQTFKGEVSDEGISAIAAVVASLTDPADIPASPME
jgi:hypothetical protein